MQIYENLSNHSLTNFVDLETKSFRKNPTGLIDLITE